MLSEHKTTKENAMRAKLFISFLACIGTFWSLPASADDFLADRHGKIGIKCEQCHGIDAKNPEMPTIDTCIKCHPTNTLVDKTKDVKPKNPHTSPHYQDKLDCVNCHLGHEKSEDFCAQCHNFGFKVP